MTREQIVEEFRKLSPEDRRAVMAEIADMVEPEPLDAELVRLARERSAELASGKVKGIPADEVFRELRRKYT
jgi:hypothetical protein